MKKFNEWLQQRDDLTEQGFFKGLVNKTKNLFGMNQTAADPNTPQTGDALKIFNLYKGNGTYLVSDITDGNLLIDKDGSVHLQFPMGNAIKIANSIQQAKLEPNGRRSWKINRHLD